MRDDFGKFNEAGIQIVVVAKDSVKKVASYFQENNLPYIGIPDPKGNLAKNYQQQWKIAKLGLMPAMFLIDTKGAISYLHYSSSMSDIPENKTVLEQAGKLSQPLPD